MAPAERLQIKVCGLSDRANAAAVAALGPDFIGFNFWPQSRRFVGKDFEKVLPVDAALSVKRIGVFVDSEPAEVERAVQECALQGVQLHGGESVEYCRGLRKTCPDLLIIKALAVGDVFPAALVEQFSKEADYLLFDTPSEGFGGSGRRFDWRLLEEYSGPVPALIAGGVDETNLEYLKELRRKGRAIAGVDINSRVEIEPGLKSIERVKQVMERL